MSVIKPLPNAFVQCIGVSFALGVMFAFFHEKILLMSHKD